MGDEERGRETQMKDFLDRGILSKSDALRIAAGEAAEIKRRADERRQVARTLIAFRHLVAGIGELAKRFEAELEGP